jgi:hypothetical protein
MKSNIFVVSGFLAIALDEAYYVVRNRKPGWPDVIVMLIMAGVAYVLLKDNERDT